MSAVTTDNASNNKKAFAARIRDFTDAVTARLKPINSTNLIGILLQSAAYWELYCYTNGWRHVGYAMT